MKIDASHVFSGLSLLAVIASMILVNRNARRATAVSTENADLTRIRDLRAELKEAKAEVDQLTGQIGDIRRQLNEASDAAMDAYRWRAEALRYARMPGMDMDTWLARFDTPSGPSPINPPTDRSTP